MNQAECPRCLKPLNLCLCAELPALATRLHVLVLQHPQEPDKLLGSARLAHLALPNSTLKVGLSWPNLKAALGAEADPSLWAVLYLGSGVKSERLGGMAKPGIQFVAKTSAPLEETAQSAIAESLTGIVVLDGTWSQAKALWWRNAWLLKLRRAILVPETRSLYGELRREPRRECLSTIETIADTLRFLGEPSETAASLKEIFARLLEAYRQNYRTSAPRRRHAARRRRPRN